MKMKLNLIVSEPLPLGDIGSRIFKTMITHPKLEGALYFIHGENNRDETLGAITNSIIDDVNEILTTIKELKNS